MVDLAPNGGLDFVLEEMINGVKFGDGRVRYTCMKALKRIKERVEAGNEYFRAQAANQDPNLGKMQKV